MEKLIELLNKFETEKGLKSGIHIRWKIGPHGELLHGTRAGAGYSELKLISKKYKFIKWLVVNNKIDLEELEKELSGMGIYHNIGYYEGLLMLLSIQDNLIEFLISILK